MYRIERPGNLGKALRILLICTGVVGLFVNVGAAAFLSSHSFVLHVPPQGQTYPPPRFTYTGAPVLGWLWIPNLVSYATIIVWCIWQHHATANLWARGYGGLRTKPGWAVGWWFIPFANFGMPLVSMLELDRRSTPEGVTRKASPLFGWWWASWLAYQILPAFVITGLVIDEMVKTFRTANSYTTSLDLSEAAHRIAPWIGVVGCMQLVAAVLAFFVVERIDRSQTAMLAPVFAAPPRPDL
jgi:hypothetical protein